MNDRPWDVFHQHFRVLKPPLQATPETAAAIAAAIAGHSERALLLGVTPALADIAEHTTAIDWSGKMVTRVWPGDTQRRRAIEADWRAMPIEDSTFTAVIGDGSFNCLHYPDGYRAVFTELARVLAPAARLAIRFFTTPSPGENFSTIHDDAMAGRITAIDALKWRLGMAVAAARADANVARGAIHAAFDETFPDRAALLDGSFWDEGDLQAVDWYKGIADIISFPTTREILAVAPQAFRDPRFVSSGTYELAERCPILVVDFQP